MANKKTNIIKDALLDAKRIEEAVKANGKEILRSTMKEEISDIVKESVLDEADYNEEEVEEYSTESMEPKMEGDYMESSESEEMDYDSVDMEGSEEMDYDMGDMDMTTASDEEVIAIYKKMNGEDEIEVVGDKIHLSISEPGDYVIDTSGAGAGEAEVPELDSPMDYEAGDEMGADDDMEMDSEDAMDFEAGDEMGADDDMEMDSEEEEVEEMAYESDVNESLTYEITINEMEDIEGQTAPVGKIKNNNFAGDNLEGGFTEEDPNAGKDAHSDHVMETEDVAEGDTVTEEEEDCDETIEEKISSGVGMSVGKHRNQSGPNSIGSPEGPGAKVNEAEVKVSKMISESNEMKIRYNKLLKEAKGLMAEKVEFQKTLKKLRNQLIETAVFNSNLAAVTRLFTEHTTTKEEKQQILKRFDNGVTSTNESQKLYRTIKNELKSKKPLKESVESKIIVSANSGSKKPKLDESTVYVDREVERIKDLMSRVK